MAIAELAAPLTSSCSDEELVVAVRRGNDRAFEELYGRYGARIRSYVRGMVRDHGRAEDLTQEVFLSALRRLRETERPIALKPWLYEIAKNACIDAFRRQRRVREVPLDSGSNAENLISQWFVSPADSALDAKQRLDDLRGAFHGLSENHHRVIVMREFEGMSSAQIGARMGMSTQVVESTLFRARRRLSEEYDELVSGRRCEHVRAVIAADGERPLRALGLRERRQLARHLSHCQPCRRVARLAGVDDSFFHAPGLAGKIAALLPVGWLRARARRSGRGGRSGSTAAVHPGDALGRIQSLGMLDPAAASGVGRAAAAVAAIVVVGAGGGVVAGLTGHRSAPRTSSGMTQSASPSAGHLRRARSTSTAAIAASSRHAQPSGAASTSSAGSVTTSSSHIPSGGLRPGGKSATLPGASILSPKLASGGGKTAATSTGGGIKLPKLPALSPPNNPSSPLVIPNPLSLLAPPHDASLATALPKLPLPKPPLSKPSLPEPPLANPPLAAPGLPKPPLAKPVLLSKAGLLGPLADSSRLLRQP